MATTFMLVPTQQNTPPKFFFFFLVYYLMLKVITIGLKPRWEITYRYDEHYIYRSQQWYDMKFDVRHTNANVYKLCDT